MVRFGTSSTASIVFFLFALHFFLTGILGINVAYIIEQT